MTPIIKALVAVAATFLADYGNSNTVILVGLPRGEHKVRIEAVDPEGKPFTARTVTFTVPGPASASR